MQKKLNIIAPLGGKRSFSQIYPNDPLILISKEICTISDCAKQKLRIDGNSRIIYSIVDGVSYIAVLPLHSSQVGYKVRVIAHTKNVYTSSKTGVDRGLKIGHYLIGEPVYMNDIDWFTLEPFEL